jgi:mono/diheme cytochrome c family protein
MLRLFQILICLFAATAVHAQAKKVVAHKTVAKPVAVSPAALDRGKTVYAANCLTCHQANGGGVPNLNPPLTGTKWVKGPKANLIQFVLKGSKGQVVIDDETFHNAMPAQAHLTDEQIADVLTYVRNSFGNKSSAVTPAEVAAARAKTK